MTPRSRPRAVVVCFGVAALCLLTAALLAAWDAYGTG